MFVKKGMDVSYAQGKIDWKKVKADGIEFAMLRAGFGWENEKKQTDAQFHANYAGAKAVEIPVGCYHYSYATTVAEAKKEAEFLLGIIKGYQFDYPIAFDVEDACQRNLPKKLLTEIVLAFCEVMKKAGYYAILYTNLDWIRNRFDMARLSHIDLWYAQYNKIPTYKGNYGIWQHTSVGKVNGICSKVDLDICRKDYPTIIRKAAKNGYSSQKKLTVGDKVQYIGRLYGDSYGGHPGKNARGTFLVMRIINDRKCGVLLPCGWVSEQDCKSIM